MPSNESAPQLPYPNSSYLCPMNPVRSIVYTACTAIILCLSACNNAKDKAPQKSAKGAIELSPVQKELYALDEKVFKESIRLKDPYTALYAAHALIELDAKHSRKYQDTLAAIYIALQMPNSAGIIATEQLKTDPDNKTMLEIKITNAMMEGRPEEALNINKKLFGMTNSPKYLFQIAYIQIESGKSEEALKALEEMKAHPKYNTDSVKIQAEAQGGTQNVPLPAADQYLRAYMDIRKNQYPSAIQKFQAALKIYPQFYKARENLQAVIQGMQQQQQQQRR